MDALKNAVPNSDDDEVGLSDDFASEDEYIDSDDYEEEDQLIERGGNKRKKPSHGGFILDEAEVDDLDEEISEEEEGFKEAQIKDRIKLEREKEYLRKRQKKFVDLDDEQQLQELVARYENRVLVEEGEEAPRHISTIEKQKLLPGVSNPYLWMVRCQMGEERKLTFLLMRKSLQLAAKNEPLNIKSVIQMDRLKGYIYIEAYKSTHVKQAIEGIHGFRFGTYNQKMVPIEEMTDVLRVIRNIAEIKPNTWARFKRGLYKDDLTLIQSYESLKGVAILKIIPRLDYAEMATPGSHKENQHRFRPVAALFDRDKAHAAGAEFTSEGGHIVCKGRRFKNGFMIKRIHVSSLNIEGITPTLKELQKFNMTLDAAEAHTISQKIEYSLSVGDIVQAVEGELVNLVGVITSISDNIVSVQPKNSELKEPQQFGLHELIKYFKVGDHVKIIRGKFKDESGLVVRVENGHVVLLSDLSIKELQVLSRDIQLCNEKCIGYDDSGQFTIHDFVQIDSQTIGVIVGIECDSISVLDQFSKAHKTKPQNLIKKNLYGGMFIDQFGNRVLSGDTVRVVDGHHRGLRGQFKYIYRGFVFIFSKMLSENANMLVTRTKNLIMDSSADKSNSTTFSSGASSMSFQGGSSPNTSGSYVGIGRSPTVRRMNEMSRDNTLIGSTVRVIKGPFKGHIGIVKDSTSVLVRVELHTKPKTINVDRNNITIYKEDSRTSVKPISAFKGPTIKEKIMIGSQTPSHDVSKTPRYGNMTPAQDGSATPTNFGGVWDALNTPSHNANMDDDIMDSFLDFNPKADINSSLNQKFEAAFADEISPNSFLIETPSVISPAFPIPSSSPAIFTPTPGVDTPSPNTAEISLDSSPAMVAIEAPVTFEKGTEVIISNSFSESSAANKHAVVLDTSDPDMYFLKTLNENRSIDSRSKVFHVEPRFLTPATPKTGKLVTIKFKDNILFGTLVGIDQSDGIVELDQKSKKIFATGEDVSIFLLKNMLSYVPVI